MKIRTDTDTYIQILVSMRSIYVAESLMPGEFCEARSEYMSRYIHTHIYTNIYIHEGGPKNNRNLNVTRELEVVARCAARYGESTQYSSSLQRGVSLG
jgi:hypothetical protein